MTNQVEVVEVVEVVELSKAQKSQLIFEEEAAKGDDKLRARCMKRFEDELSMQKAGASTYFQNCKTRSKGEKVKHYRQKKDDVQTVDNSDDNVPESFEVKLNDGNIKCFLSQLEADLFIESNPSIVDPDQSVEEVEDEAA